MQALSSYNPEKQAVVGAALRDLEQENEAQGLIASTWVSPAGWSARFVWPDWPPETVLHVSERVRTFHRDHPELQPLQEDSPEWNGVFFGWHSDPVSANAIAAGIRKHFRERVLWVESERDTRGRAAARCRIRGLVRFETFREGPLAQVAGVPTAADSEVVSLELSWKHSLATPKGPLSDSDKELFDASVKEIAAWAARRIQPILDALHERLQRLYGNRFRGLYVFGSYARPDAGIELPVDSDLDVAVLVADLDSKAKEIEASSEIVSDLSLEHGLVISLKHLREVDFREGRTNFARVISSYAVPVE